MGSTASLTIDGGSFPVGGPYIIRWSKRPLGGLGEEGTEGVDFVVVGRGEVPRDTTKLTATFTIPEAAYGINYVQLVREYRFDFPYSFSFSVVPDIKVSPASGSPGTEVTITGRGFPATNKEMSVSFDGAEVKKELITSEKGSFSYQFTIPETIAGRHEFRAAAEAMYISDARASFEVCPTVNMEPELPEIGMEVTFSGSGFAASSPISIKYDNIDITDSPDTNNSGSFSHKFKVPESARDEHIITATDKAGNTATYGLPLEGEPPPTPSPLFPIEGQRFGMFGRQTVTFRWEAVDDPSGVTYTLEMGHNVKVWPPVAMRTGLTSTICTLDLEPGTYYWRIKAVDGAGNESDWDYAPYPFKVALFPIWSLIIVGLLFLVAFVFIFRAFYRRLREYMK